jgi:hypothetical protein
MTNTSSQHDCHCIASSASNTGDLNGSVVSEQNIAGFDVAMDLSVGVKILESFEHFLQHCGDRRLIEDPMTTVLALHPVFDYV